MRLRAHTDPGAAPGRSPPPPRGQLWSLCLHLGPGTPAVPLPEAEHSLVLLGPAPRHAWCRRQSSLALRSSRLGQGAAGETRLSPGAACFEAVPAPTLLPLTGRASFPSTGRELTALAWKPVGKAGSKRSGHADGARPPRAPRLCRRDRSHPHGLGPAGTRPRSAPAKTDATTASLPAAPPRHPPRTRPEPPHAVTHARPETAQPGPSTASLPPSHPHRLGTAPSPPLLPCTVAKACSRRPNSTAPCILATAPSSPR